MAQHALRHGRRAFLRAWAAPEPDDAPIDGFAVHQDTEDFDFIEYTIVVKLTADAPGEPPSAMRVVGAPLHFHYGTEAGACGCFKARLYHVDRARVERGAPEDSLLFPCLDDGRATGETCPRRISSDGGGRACAAAQDGGHGTCRDAGCE